MFALLTCAGFCGWNGESLTTIRRSSAVDRCGHIQCQSPSLLDMNSAVVRIKMLALALGALMLAVNISLFCFVQYNILKLHMYKVTVRCSIGSFFYVNVIRCVPCMCVFLCTQQHLVKIECTHHESDGELLLDK